jgi:hypothetical protein
MDLPAAGETIARLRTLERDFGVHIALAHDVSWILDGGNKVLTSLIEPELLRIAQVKCPQNAIL